MQHFLCPIIFVLPYRKPGILFTGESHTVVENRSMDSHPPKPITTTLPGHVSNICMTQHRFTRFRTPLRHGQSFHSIIKTSNLKCKANTTSQQARKCKSRNSEWTQQRKSPSIYKKRKVNRRVEITENANNNYSAPWAITEPSSPTNCPGQRKASRFRR